MAPIGNDRWRGTFPVARSRYEYTVEGWVDQFHELAARAGEKVGAAQDVTSELLEGAAIVHSALGRVEDRGRGQAVATRIGLSDAGEAAGVRVAAAMSEDWPR